MKIDKIDIFDEINRELEKQDRKAPWLAKEVGTSSRNMHSLLNTRKDIYVDDLINISKGLKRNFFKLYIPFVDAAISASTNKVDKENGDKSENKSTLRVGIKYPESQTGDVGTFLKHLKLLASEYGFEVE
jgi:hypothetical protein